MSSSVKRRLTAYGVTVAALLGGYSILVHTATHAAGRRMSYQAVWRQDFLDLTGWTSSTLAPLNPSTILQRWSGRRAARKDIAAGRIKFTVFIGLQFVTPEEMDKECEAISELEHEYGLTPERIGCVQPQGPYWVAYWRTMDEEIERRYGRAFVTRVFQRHRQEAHAHEAEKECQLTTR